MHALIRSTLGHQLALVLAAGAVGAQPVLTLRTPNATLPADFSQVRGVRELPDGRVIVSDRIEERVSVADFGTGRLQAIGRTGRGPREFHLPTALAPMPGDSTLLTDEGNSRLAVIAPPPGLGIQRSFALDVPGIPVALGARGVDAAGRFYLQIPGWLSGARERGDSVWLVRFDARTRRVDTLASLKGSTSPPARDGRQMGIPFVPFSPQDNWAVARDGRVAIVRSGDYHVEWLGADGALVRGPPTAFERIPVTPQDRVAYMRSFLANSPVGGRDPGGGMSATPAEFLTDRSVREMAERNTFAATMAPFSDTRPQLGPGGTLWVERSAHAGEPSRWDVFDAAGRLTRRVVLPRGRRLAALGAAAAYLVATDEDGVEHLERYAVRPAP